MNSNYPKKQCKHPECWTLTNSATGYCRSHGLAFDPPVSTDDMHQFCLWYPNYVEEIKSYDSVNDPYETALCTAFIEFGFEFDLPPFSFRMHPLVKDLMDQFGIPEFRQGYWFDIDDLTARLRFIDHLRIRCVKELKNVAT